MKKQAFFYYLALYEEFFFNIESKMKIMEIFNKFRQLAKKLQEFRFEVLSLLFYEK